MGICPLSGEPLDEDESESTAAAGLGEACAGGGCTDPGNAGSFCAAARPLKMVIARKGAASLMGDRDNYSFPGCCERPNCAGKSRKPGVSGLPRFGLEKISLTRHVIPSFCPHMQVLVICSDLDGAILSAGLEL